MRLTFPYGQQSLTAELPDTTLVARPTDLPALPDPTVAVRAALAAPIGTPPLREIARGNRTVTIVINDVTRPCPTGLLVAEILRELAHAGLGRAT